MNPPATRRSACQLKHKALYAILGAMSKEVKRRKNPAAVALGRLGGRKGGKAKGPKGFALMTPEQRREAGRTGGFARWDADTLEPRGEK